MLRYMMCSHSYTADSIDKVVDVLVIKYEVVDKDDF